MNKNFFNNLIVLFYPFFLLAVSYMYWISVEDAKRAYQVPVAQSVIFNIIFFLTLGLFLYYFLIMNGGCHIIVLVIGICESLIFMFPKLLKGITEDLYLALTENYMIFGMILTIYIVLLLNRIWLRVRQNIDTVR